MNIHDEYKWQSVTNIPSRKYVCGHCGSPLASDIGYVAAPATGRQLAYMYICHFCTRPTLFEHDGYKVPDAPFGRPIEGIDDASVRDLYEEARKSTGVGAHTGTVLCCRKLLMHIAVAKGAEKNRSFQQYVDFLAEKNFVPPDAKPWVDHIRDRGNEANHEITIMKREDAEELLSFVEMLLRVIFEFPATVRKKYGKKEDKKA